MLKFGDFLPFSFCFAGFKCYPPFFGSMGLLPPSENSTYFLNKQLHLNLNISSLNKKSTGKMTNDNLYIWPWLFNRKQSISQLQGQVKSTLLAKSTKFVVL